VLVLAVAFLGWLGAGLIMSITQLVGQPAAVDLLARSGALDAARYHALTRQQAEVGSRVSPGDEEQLKDWKEQVARWFAWYQCAFLFGAATGGLAFGRLGDRVGRVKGMALSILTYSGLAAAASAAQSPEQFLVLWFLACTGVGGIWPNGVALVAETWTALSRPMAAGVIGTAANIGLFLMATIATKVPITPDDWRWVMGVGAAPLVVGLFALVAVPESPRWLADRAGQAAGQTPAPPRGEVFRPPLLGVTMLAAVLATVPMIGGWGSANWMIPWAAEAGAAASPPDPFLKAKVGQARALTGIVGSLLGGWVASIAGRRRAYFLVSLLALVIAQYTFHCLVPTDRWFLAWVAALGFVSGLYFGWLPLFLPELFPTRVRSTGAGVGFNFGRIVTAVTVFVTGAITAVFEGDYARIGQVTSLVFAVGMVAIWFAPDTTRKPLAD
jgi:MFS family permease